MAKRKSFDIIQRCGKSAIPSFNGIKKEEEEGEEKFYFFYGRLFAVGFNEPNKKIIIFESRIPNIELI